MNRKKILGLGILLLLAIIWGSSFILMKRGLEVFSATEVATLRILLSSILFFPIFLHRLRKINWSLWPYILIVALCGSGFPAFLFATAQTHISSSLAGILNSLTPLFTFIFGLFFFQTVFRWTALWGVFIGLIGSIVLLFFTSAHEPNGSYWYSILAILGSACYGISGNTVKTYLQSMGAFGLNATTFSLLGPFALLYLSTTDCLSIIQQKEGAWEALGYIAILSWVGTFAATVLFFQLIQWTDALFGSTVSYLIPIVAVSWGFLDGEHIAWYHVVGLGLIISGIYAIRVSMHPNQS